MRVALYHNLGPGGALRVVDQQVRWRSPDIEYVLYEPRAAMRRRQAASFATDLADGCARHEVLAPVPRPRWHRLAPQLAWLRRQDALERATAAQIDAAGHDLVVVHPDTHTYTPGLLTHLRTRAVYFMQEPPRFLFEANARRAPAGWRARNERRLVDAALRHRAAAAATAPQVTLVCNSLFSAESIVRAYGTRPRVCRLGVDLETFALGAPTRERAVLVVGGLERAKRPELVVQALGLIDLERRPALHLVYERATPGVEADLEQLSAERGVMLHLHRGIDDAQLASLYRRVACTVCVPELEPFGLTVLESLAAGTPVVAVREGGPRETVRDGLDGVLVEPTPSAVASGVAQVLADPSAYPPQRLRADLEAGEWSSLDFARRLEAILREVVQRAGD